MMNTTFPTLSPSLLACDFSRLEEELTALERAGLSWVHWDVMDGHFVPNITFGPPVMAACREGTSLFFDVHLMISDPDRYVEPCARAGADLLCVHAEASPDLGATIGRILELQVLPAVALSPDTPLSAVQPHLRDLAMVLIMSVHPGFGGQSFIPASLDRIRDLRTMIEHSGSTAVIEVDGGISPDNAGDIVAAGASVLVSGSAFFAHPPYSERHQDFRRAWGRGRPAGAGRSTAGIRRPTVG